uniref:Secreted protein n=1 Tax=Anopheles darlingi TaxID=43151 RepID=A0A2M4DFF5_ANODA
MSSPSLFVVVVVVTLCCDSALSTKPRSNGVQRLACVAVCVCVCVCACVLSARQEWWRPASLRTRSIPVFW